MNIVKTHKKRILIYAHYYIPDTASTGQLLQELAEGMLDKFEITIICVVPSYTGIVAEKYKTNKFYYEKIGGINVLRIRVPEFEKANKVSRIKNISAYFFGAMKATKMVGMVDYVFSISQPPIIGGLLGIYGKQKKHAKFIYNIQDFNPEQVKAVNYSKKMLIINVMMFLDKFSCKHSDLVITVGRDLVQTMEKRFAGKKMPKTVMINNWISESEVYPVVNNHEQVIAFKKRYKLVEKFIIMYSGNIGLYYDFQNLIKVIKKFKPGTKAANGKEVVFAFVGAGAMLETLKKYVNDNSMSNVVFIPYQDKADLIYSLNSADVHLCVNAKGIKGVSCPSKYYGIAAVQKPVIGVLEKGSEIRCIIEETNCGFCSEPGDYEHVERHIKWFIENADNVMIDIMGKNGRENLIRNMTKSISVRKYEKEILEC